jgi:hypothetical protein
MRIAECEMRNAECKGHKMRHRALASSRSAMRPTRVRGPLGSARGDTLRRLLRRLVRYAPLASGAPSASLGVTRYGGA